MWPGIALTSSDLKDISQSVASCKILYILLTNLAHMACMQVLAQSGLHLCSIDHKEICTLYSETSLIRTSLNRNLANPNGNALVNFFFFFNFFF